MNNGIISTTEKSIFYRLTALWIFVEAFAGGILHGLKIPITGLMIGSAAVICICLLAGSTTSKNSILKATLLVALFKMLLSPYSPPTAYIAVAFQGLLGSILLSKKSWHWIMFPVFGCIALLESAFQRLLLMWLVYGKDFWTALNESLNRFFSMHQFQDILFKIAFLYTLLHIVLGFFAGWIAYLILKKANGWHIAQRYSIASHSNYTTANIIINNKKKKKLHVLLWVMFGILILFYLQALLYPHQAFLSKQLVLWVIIRALIIVLIWYLIIGPLFNRWLKQWLDKKNANKQSDIEMISTILPETIQHIKAAWQSTNNLGFIQRLKTTLKIIITHTLFQPIHE
ncbi:MAG: hypothetical protein ACOYKE_08770 [Ferruginibacter sp.]